MIERVQSLFGWTPTPKPPTLQERFEQFHAENSHVYHSLVALAKSWKSKGHDHASIAMFYEVLRYEYGLTITPADFKLNNSYRSRYARMIMANEPDLAGFFDLRELKAGE